MSEDLYRVTRDGPVNVVELLLPQHLDAQEFDRLNDSLLTALAAKPDGRWVVDLTALAYMGSPLLGLMVNLRQRVLQAGGKLALCGLSPQLLRIFTTCCLQRLFVISKTRPDAVRAAGR